MNNIERLKKYISQVEGFIADTEKRIAGGAEWLDAQLGSLKRLLDDLCRQLDEATEQEEGMHNPAYLEYGQSAVVLDVLSEPLANPGEQKVSGLPYFNVPRDLTLGGQVSVTVGRRRLSNSRKTLIKYMFASKVFTMMSKKLENN